MHHRSRAWITTSALVLAAAAGAGGLAALRPTAPTTPTSETAAGAWNVDPVHSFVVFKIRHSGASNAYGMIHNPTGSFTIDAAKPEASSLEVTLQAEKVSTGNDGRDKHIRSPDFFNAKEFPAITFKSKAFKSAGENTFDVTGDLTFLGQTKPVTARLAVVGTTETVMGVEATFTIKRSDFGNTKSIGPGSDEVHLTVALEGKNK